MELRVLDVKFTTDKLTVGLGVPACEKGEHVSQFTFVSEGKNSVRNSFETLLHIYLWIPKCP
jgi:hypothetical protein